MYSLNCLIKSHFTGFLYLLLFTLSFAVPPCFAEGSKEINANGGTRAFLVSGNTVTPSFLFPTLGTMKVYAKAGETINIGSSVQGKGSGTINLRAPNGNTYTSGASATIGLIANHSQELAGPLPNAGGYTPYTQTVLAAEDGIWEIDFISENNGLAGGENPVPIAANANWTQPTGQYIAAFDITVRNNANTAIPGRVYTNIFSGILGTYDVGFNGIFNILTKDGYQYSLNNNGQAGNGFSFFVNNKGFRQADGTASYKSVNSLISPNIQDPRAADTQTDITYKIFFNPPSADLPATAATPGGGTTWLLSPVIAPSITGLSFSGSEGSINTAGSSPLGAAYNFIANKNGTYIISIDINHNGTYTDAVDRKLTGNVLSGSNAIPWDGRDGLGNQVTPGSYASNINLVLFGGEVHFPFFDVERNVNGIRLTRNNGTAAPDNFIYWDDSPIAVVGTASSPLKNTTAPGINSFANGHSWGSPGASATDFGDEKGLDTWAYIAATPVATTQTIQLQEADLEVINVGVSSTGNCAGQDVTYTVNVRNNGPGNATGSKFSFNFPAELTNVSATSNVPANSIASVTSPVVGTNAYTATLDITNTSVCTFIIKGKVAVSPAGTTVVVMASILRPADLTDPDATNPDVAVPTDPQAECDAGPSGIGCNNIKTNSTVFQGVPEAGPDQSIFQKQTVTLTATGPGTWSQAGSSPTLTAIATPEAISTTVTGLTDVGIYTFVRGSALGCTDTVLVTVVPQSINIPTIITPNGDGKNDVFVVPDISLFPGTQLIIFNRWGNEVYRSESYQNTWNGDGLTEGTYYYILNKKEPSGSVTTYKGWVFIKR